MWYHYFVRFIEFRKGGIIIINLKLIRENGDVKFKAYGTEIDEHFHGEYEAGDKFRIELDGGKFVKLKLDSTMLESIVYIPDGVFEFIVPRGNRANQGSAGAGPRASCGCW